MMHDRIVSMIKAKPEKQVQQVENILEKMGKKWQKIIAGKGK
jgi:flagellin-specific chaperone FliS